MKKFLVKNNIQIIKKSWNSILYKFWIIINSEEFKTGKIIVQDGSSYLAALNLNANINDLVLDICAAPGVSWWNCFSIFRI